MSISRPLALRRFKELAKKPHLSRARQVLASLPSLTQINTNLFSYFSQKNQPKINPITYYMYQNKVNHELPFILKACCIS
jgi:hypothetical protein